MLYAQIDGAVKRLAAADLIALGGPTRLDVDTPVALREGGPFAPLADSIERNGPLRDVLARAISIPSLRGYQRLRLGVLAATLLPSAMLLELDRELVGAGHASAERALVDLVLVAFVVFELSRRSPRLPGVCAIALVTIGLRWILVASRLCGRGVHPLVYAAAALSVGAALALLGRSPSRARVILELLDKLGITRSRWFAATHGPDPPAALVAAAVGCAAGLPAVLHLTRFLGGGLGTQAAVFVGFATVAPELVRRTIVPGARRASPFALRPPRLVFGIAAGLALTAAAVTAAKLFFDAGAEIAQCVQRLDVETKLARAAESAEVAKAIAKVRASTPLVIMTALVFPLAEERIYRDLLQDVLSRKYGRAYGMFAASLAFAVAHIGIYQVALYQTLLLGLGFGLAWVEGGLLAAFAVHATWNLLQLA